MKRYWTSPFWSALIAGCALVFIVWSITLIRNVTAHQETLKAHLLIVNDLILLEKNIRGFGDMIYQDPLPGPENWQQNRDEYQQTLDHIRSFSHESVEEIDSVLTAIDFSVQRMSDRFLVMQQGDSLLRENRRLDIVFHEEMTHAADMVKREIDGCRDKINTLSTTLTSEWQSLNILILVSCLLAILVAAILYIFQKDIEKRKRVEAALHQITAEFRAMFKSIPDAVVFTDMNYEIIMVNPAFSKLFGYQPEKIMGRNRSMLFEESEVILPTPSRNGDVQTKPFEINCLSSDNRVFIGERVDMLVRQESSEMGIITIVRDITERKKVETAANAAHEKLEMWVNERTEDLMRANEEVKRFAYIVSHDLRAPLVNIKGFAGELRHSVGELSEMLTERLSDEEDPAIQEIRNILTEEIPESLQFIDSSASRMGSLIDAVLKLSRLGRRELRFEQINVRELLQKILDSLAHQIDSHNIEIVIGDLPNVTADPTSLEQMIGNILVNAINYREEGRRPQIKISGEQRDYEVLYCISDNGRGISLEDMSKVFEPFSRAGQQNVPGEGMGLAYVKTLVRRHGGRIWCHSKLGEGTQFYFTLSNHHNREAEPIISEVASDEAV